MAQERIKWTYLEGTIQIGFENETLEVYDLTVMFPDIETMSEVQRGLVIYGFKQNLSDKIAGMKDYTMKEKVRTMTSRYNDLALGIWKTPAKEKISVKKKAEELAKSNSLTIQDVELLKKLGLYTEEIAKAFNESK